MNKIWSVLLGFAAVVWFLNIVYVLQGHELMEITVITACIITGSTCVKWAVEAWNEE